MTLGNLGRSADEALVQRPASPEGEIAVMFRNAIEGARDLYLTRSHDGGRMFEPAARLGSGTRKLEACPMDAGDWPSTGEGPW